MGTLLLAVVLAGCGGGDQLAVESSAPAMTAVGGLLPRVNGLEAAQSADRAAPSEARDFRKAVQVVDTPTGFTGNGWYWNPAEGGTGFFFEAQGKSAYVGLFVYDDAGRATWYAGLGAIQSAPDGYFFSGTLNRYTGGQPASSGTRSAPEATEAGSLSITFSGDGVGSVATVSLPGGRTMIARRFAFDSAGPKTYGSSDRPETGWYWNPANAGQGWAVEVQGESVFMVMYHFRADGSPTWNTVQGSLQPGELTAGFNAFSGGQSLSGSYRVAKSLPTESFYSLSGLSSCALTVMYPGQLPLLLSRFRFGRIPAGAECRASYVPSLVSPDNGSTIAVGDGLAGHWAAGSQFGIVDTTGGMYLLSSESLFVGASGPYDFWTYIQGTVRTNGTSSWSTTGARTSNSYSGYKANVRGSGLFTPASLLQGSIGSASFNLSYGPDNGRALDLASLQGRWVSDGLQLQIGPTGVISGSSTGFGDCRLSGQISNSSTNNRMNLFTINLNAEMKLFPIATVSTLCKLTGAFSGLGSVVRVALPSDPRLRLDRLRFHLWSSGYNWVAEAVRQ